MTPTERDWMEELLGVQPPWQVQSVRIADRDPIVAVQIGRAPESSPRFWGSRRASPGGKRLHWHHLGLAGRRCEITLQLAEGQNIPQAPWSGDPDLPFTHALSRQVLDLMLDGATMAQLCRLLELPLGELWKYKFRLDQGSARAPRVDPAPPPVVAAMPRPEPGTPEGEPAVPAEDDPVWQALLTGRRTLEVQALSLRLLLSKLIREAASHDDPDLHRQAAQSLQRYFLRHQALLGPELRQLTRRTEGEAGKRLAGPVDGRVPEVSDPLWLAVLNGDCALDVRALSLRLLLSRLRQQRGALLDDELRMLQLVELHRYFSKHHRQLQHELAQLHRWHVH